MRVAAAGADTNLLRTAGAPGLHAVVRLLRAHEGRRRPVSRPDTGEGGESMCGRVRVTTQAAEIAATYDAKRVRSALPFKPGDYTRRRGGS